MTIDHAITTVAVPMLERLVARGRVWTRVAEEYCRGIIDEGTLAARLEAVRERLEARGG